MDSHKFLISAGTDMLAIEQEEIKDSVSNKLGGKGECHLR